MKRMINYHLRLWKEDPYRKPLLLRGARQVGKTYAIRSFGQSFTEFVEINFEFLEKAGAVFDNDLDPIRIIRELSLITQTQITPGKTLLFLDEIQVVPKALTALRYFYEQMPELHVIAAGSLLDFAIEEVGIPVGRVQSLYLYPLSFIEFLVALGETLIVEEILKHEIEQPMSNVIHQKILRRVAEYLALGGMPEVVSCWQNISDPRICARAHSTIIDAYRIDFGKYAKKNQIKYVELVFKSIPVQLGHRFKFSIIEGEFRKRELAPALDLLETAGLAHKVYYSSSQGFPFGAQVHPLDYKVLFADVGLAQAVLELDLANWFLNPLNELINKGDLTESFVGQEILSYSNPHRKPNLYYWHSEKRTSEAEVDYVIQEGDRIVPVEIKSGKGSTLKSLHAFLESHEKAPYGIRFSTHNYSVYDNVHSYPLYAIAKVIIEKHEEVKKSIAELLS